MTRTALHYVLSQVQAPKGRTLWLYDGPGDGEAEIYQPRQDLAQGFTDKGHRVLTEAWEVTESYEAVFLHCPKQREEAEGLMALAFARSSGLVMVVAANDAGGTRLRSMMEAYGVPLKSEGKSHCRVVWTLEAAAAKQEVIDAHLDQLALRQVDLGGELWWSVPGIFSWDRVDAGSRLLLQYLPTDLSGKVADFGCGYGYLSGVTARNHPKIEQIDAYDVDARAVACCARNGGEKVNAIWQDVTTLKAGANYDVVIMNPPFHTGKNEDIDLGRAFIAKAVECLKPGGRLFLVANRHLGYELVVPGLTSLYESGAYKVLAKTKS